MNRLLFSDVINRDGYRETSDKRNNERSPKGHVCREQWQKSRTYKDNEPHEKRPTYCLIVSNCHGHHRITGARKNLQCFLCFFGFGNCVCIAALRASFGVRGHREMGFSSFFRRLLLSGGIEGQYTLWIRRVTIGAHRSPRR